MQVVSQGKSQSSGHAHSDIFFVFFFVWKSASDARAERPRTTKRVVNMSDSGRKREFEVDTGWRKTKAGSVQELIQ